MSKNELKDGTVHKLPSDLKHALLANSSAMAAWQNLTPLARNEWICWIITVKRDSTRQNHLKRTISELLSGQRRPCCWMGCIHRTDKSLSPSVRWVLKQKSKAGS